MSDVGPSSFIDSVFHRSELKSDSIALTCAFVIHVLRRLLDCCSFFLGWKPHTPPAMFYRLHSNSHVDANPLLPSFHAPGKSYAALQ